MTLKKIDAAIASVAKSGEAFNVLVHNTIIAILEHAQAHNDCTRALALVMAMPKSMKRTAVINSFADYSPIGMNVKGGKVGFHKEGGKAFREFDIDGYRANPWFLRAEAQNEELPDTTLEAVNKAIASLVARMTKRIDEGKVAANDKAAIVARLAKLAA